ncbi:hypothetical protein B5X24_HaOG206858 [Helicoverpa armigera]|uniref:Uncharacterized protein n=1 Tax=Helicoverpa armigera TaxID=29058 RepID=A0A2W1BNW9_HELAM|nr:hypothetical protein B5X24_HaOG206858 [Helicoverpa armigera]
MSAMSRYYAVTCLVIGQGARVVRGRGGLGCGGVQPAAVDNRRRDYRVTHRSLCLLTARLLTSSARHVLRTTCALPTCPMTTANTSLRTRLGVLLGK